MTLRGTVAAAVLSGLFALGGPSAAQAALQSPDSLAGPGLSVPFVAQGPLLCGGAAAAMVERYWGALGVYAEDYASLVSADAGGIRTGALARALEERGQEVRVLRDRPADVFDQVRSGVPVIALLSSGENRYHYVVVVAVGGGRVVLHDPLGTPGTSMDRQDFLRRWAESSQWALVALPGFADDGTTPAGSAASPDRQADRGSPPPADVARAVQELRDGRPGVAARRMEAFLGEGSLDDSDRALAWRTLASARYLSGSGESALRAWNRVGEPRVDLVRIQGLQRIRFAPLAGYLGVRARDTLTAGSLGTARRRLLQHPAIQLGRMGYRPLRDGSVQVEVAVLEQDPLPDSPLRLAALGLDALLTGTVSVGVGPFLGVGERGSLEGSWEEARPAVAAAVAVPWSVVGGVVRFEAGWLEERYVEAAGTHDRLEREWGRVGLRSWRTPHLRAGIGVGSERWGGDRRMGWGGVSGLLRSGSGDARVAATLEGWAGEGGPLARVGLEAEGGVDPPLAGRTGLSVGIAAVGAEAPPLLWPGAGIGRHRKPLLRGHPLASNDRLGATALGRTLLHGTVEHLLDLPTGPFPLQAGVFLDGARVWDPLVPTAPRSYWDPGVELRLAVPGRAVSAALARGDGEWVFSLRLSGDVPVGLSAP